MRKKLAGLTLVELMVVLAILAIVVTIGYPMYTAQVQKARRADARTSLTLLAEVLDSHDRTFGRFAESSSITGVTFADGAPAPGLNSTFDDDLARVAREFSDYYSATIAADAGAYTITVTPVGAQTDDLDCASFVMDQTGSVRVYDSGGSDNTDLCWL